MNTPEISPNNAVHADTETATPAKTSGTGPIRVWLVDDNAKLRGLLAQLLERQGGIVCARQFASPNAVLSTLASRIGPDVILLDVHMGAENGIDAIPAIKSLSRATRVLMLTSCFDQTSRRAALESGASGFLLKSYTLEQITERICNRQKDEPAALNVRRAGHQRQSNKRRLDAALDANGEPPHEPSKSAEAGNQRQTTTLLRWLRRFARN